MALPPKTADQKRIDRLEKLVEKLISTNTQLMKQSDVHQRALRRMSIKTDAIAVQLKQVSRPATK